jgi:hypothetical protein
MATKIQKSYDLDEIWFPSRLWFCELISIVGLLWRPFWKLDSFHQTSWNFRNIHRSVWQLFGGLNTFKMAAIAMVTKVQKMYSGSIWNSTQK